MGFVIRQNGDGGAEPGRKEQISRKGSVLASSGLMTLYVQAESMFVPPPSHIYGLHTRAAALPLHEKIRVPGANRPSTGCKTGRPKRSIAGFSRAGGKASDDAQARATS